MVKKHKPTVAFYGGSFDPPHSGHQKIVKKAIEILDIDKLLVVPTYRNPLKHTALASGSTRLEWCQSLFGTIKNVSVEEYEIAQAKSTFTSNSIKYFNRKYDVKYLVIGSDNLPQLTQWHQFDWLNENIVWVIVTRKGYPLSTKILKQWLTLEIDIDISSSEIRNSKILSHVDNSIKESVKNILKG